MGFMHSTKGPFLYILSGGLDGCPCSGGCSPERVREPPPPHYEQVYVNKSTIVMSMEQKGTNIKGTI